MLHETPLDRYQRRVGVFLLVSISILLIALAGRLIHIQTTRGKSLAEAAARQQRSRSRIPARRGMVLDRGGRVLAAGPLADVLAGESTPTTDYLLGRRRIEVPATRRSGNGRALTIVAARQFNLKNITVLA